MSLHLTFAVLCNGGSLTSAAVVLLLSLTCLWESHITKQGPGLWTLKFSIDGDIFKTVKMSNNTFAFSESVPLQVKIRTVNGDLHSCSTTANHQTGKSAR